MSTHQKTHPEWEKEHSLTSPQDRDRKAQWRPDQGAPALSEEEVSLAIENLDNNDFTKKFPRVDRTYADPPISLQTIGLLSFTPAKGATPNENGVFGFAKLRGNYASELEAKQRAEAIIRTIDSYHQIYHTYVGRPFPVTDSSKYSADTDEIEIRKDMAKSVSASIKNKKGKDKKDMDEIKEREEILIAESRQKPEDVDPYENYITLKVKKAQLSWTYLEHIKKMAEVKDIIIKTRKTLTKIDASNPEFQDKYLEKYMKARSDVGLDLSKAKSSDNFLKFLVEEVKLPGIDDIVVQETEETEETKRD